MLSRLRERTDLTNGEAEPKGQWDSQVPPSPLRCLQETQALTAHTWLSFILLNCFCWEQKVWAKLLCLTICEVPLWGRKYYLSGSLPKLGKWPANRCLLNRWCFKLSWSKTVFNFKRGNCNKCQGDGSICNFPDKTNFLGKLLCNLQILIAQNSFSVIYY